MTTSKSTKTYFVQYNDQRKMYNIPSEVTKYWHNLINANNETKPSIVKYTIKMAIIKLMIKKGNRE